MGGPAMTSRTVRRVCRALLGLILAVALNSSFDVGIASATGPDRDYWVSRWEGLQQKQKAVTAELETARVDYRRGRRGNRGRGEERVELLERIDRLERELADVEQELAAFPAEAHRAGALPGWFREG